MFGQKSKVQILILTVIPGRHAWWLSISVKSDLKVPPTVDLDVLKAFKTELFGFTEIIQSRRVNKSRPQTRSDNKGSAIQPLNFKQPLAGIGDVASSNSSLFRFRTQGTTRMRN